jgi:hypothetical protein
VNRRWLKSREPALARSNHSTGVPITAEMPLQKRPRNGKEIINSMAARKSRETTDQSDTEETLVSSRKVSNSRDTSDSSDDASNTTSNSNYSR